MTFIGWQNPFYLGIQGRHDYRWKTPRLKLWHFPSIWKIWHIEKTPFVSMFKNYTCILLLFAVHLFSIWSTAWGGIKYVSLNFHQPLILYWLLLYKFQSPFKTFLFLLFTVRIWIDCILIWHDVEWEDLWHCSLTFHLSNLINVEDQFVTTLMSSRAQTFNRKVACEVDSCLIFGVDMIEWYDWQLGSRTRTPIVSNLTIWILSGSRAGYAG